MIAKTRLQNITGKNGPKVNLESDTKRNIRFDGIKTPKLELLTEPKNRGKRISRAKMAEKIDKLQLMLKSIDIKGEIDRGHGGPFVTTFEMRYFDDISKVDLRDMQEKLSKVVGVRGIRVELSKDNILNIEVPNSSFETVYLRDVIDSRQFTTSRAQLLVALGKDSYGKPALFDLKKLTIYLLQERQMGRNL